MLEAPVSGSTTVVEQGKLVFMVGGDETILEQVKPILHKLGPYFARSVQVPSHVALVANGELAGGILLQQVPGQPIEEDDWNRLNFLAKTLTQRDFEGDAGIDLLRKLFAEDDVRVYAPRAVNFKCRCSVAKAEDVLKMLGEEESRQVLAEQGGIEIICEYCGHRRHFDAVDVERLFIDNVVPGPESVQ